MHGGGTEFQLTLKAAQGDMPATTIEVPHQTLRGTCDCSSLWLRRMQHATARRLFFLPAEGYQHLFVTGAGWCHAHAGECGVQGGRGQQGWPRQPVAAFHRTQAPS